MPAISHKSMRRLYESAVKDKTPNRFFEDVGEALRAGELKPQDFSIRQLFEEFVEGGRELVDSFNPRSSGGVNLLEAGGAVDTAAFSNITGQLMYSAIMEAYQSEDYVFSKVIPTRPTQFNGEKIPGIGGLGNQTEEIGEGQPYPTAGVNEDWLETPATTKRGLIVPVTKEAIFFDRTGVLLDRCRQVGDSLAIDKENRIIDAIVDENRTTHRYRWRGTTYATYQSSTPWVNVVTSNALVDWTDIDAAEAIFSNMVDPQTGEPITIVPKDLIFTRDLLYSARRIVGATEIRVTTPGYATSGNPTEHTLSNPVQNYRLLSSARLKARMATDSTWYIGDVAKAFKYGENWPLSVVQAANNSEAEFQQDIVARFKASERGTVETHEPRAMVKCTA